MGHCTLYRLVTKSIVHYSIQACPDQHIYHFQSIRKAENKKTTTKLSVKLISWQNFQRQFLPTIFFAVYVFRCADDFLYGKFTVKTILKIFLRPSFFLLHFKSKIYGAKTLNYLYKLLNKDNPLGGFVIQHDT